MQRDLLHFGLPLEVFFQLWKFDEVNVSLKVVFWYLDFWYVSPRPTYSCYVIHRNYRINWDIYTQIRDLTVSLSYNSKSSCACMQLIGLLISSWDLWSMYFVEKGESYAAYKYNFDLWYLWSLHRFLFSSSIEPFTTFF